MVRGARADGFSVGFGAGPDGGGAPSRRRSVSAWAGEASTQVRNTVNAHLRKGRNMTAERFAGS